MAYAQNGKDLILMKNIYGIKLTLDRIEESIAICLDDENNIYETEKQTLEGIKEGHSFIADIEGGRITVKDTLEEQNRLNSAERAERRRRLFKNV